VRVFLILVIGVMSISCSSDNLSDSVDENTTPAIYEEREEEMVNTADPLDNNPVPAREEEREKEEESIYEKEGSDGLYE
jgi:hypothetical protein